MEITPIGNKSATRRKSTLRAVHIDMTPMVDLAFLLLTFFVLTATFQKHKGLDFVFPKETEENTPVKNGVTFLLTGNGRIFYYTGELGDEPRLKETSFAAINGVSALLRELDKKSIERKAQLNEERFKSRMGDSLYRKKLSGIRGASGALTVLIKTDKEARYGNVMNLLDELKTLNMTKFFNVAISSRELQLLQEARAIN